MGSGNITIESGSGSTEPFFLYKCYYTSDYSKDSNIPSGYINLYQKDGKNYASVSKDDFMGSIGDFELKNLSGHAYGLKNLPSLDDCSAFDAYLVYTNFEWDVATATYPSIIDSTKTPIQIYCIAIKTDYGNCWLAMEIEPSSPPTLKQDKFTVHESQSIEITSWELLSEAPSWCTDDPYMYRAKVSVSNITQNTMILNIVLSDSILLNIGQVIETIDGGIYLYAKSNTALSGTLITLITCEVQNA